MYVGMVDGIAKNAWVPIVAPQQVTKRRGKQLPPHRNGISRECPGPSSEATLSRPSPRRALTAGAIALAVITPAIDSADHCAEAANAATSVTQKAQAIVYDPFETVAPRRVQGASRSALRRVGFRTLTREKTATAVRALRAYTHRSVIRETAKIAAVRAATTRRLAKSRRVRPARPQITTLAHRDSARVHRGTGSVRIHRGTRQYRVVRVRRNRGRQSGGMAAVIAYARSQVGKSYVSGAEGPSSFDCSGLTKRAYAHAGLHLPHSSGGQAAHARPVSRSSARPGDLVVGRGHVGIYMGAGMMIDAGNQRTGVVYRHLYDGLRIERFISG
jgi:cell wall-associated NlpC family hydrolase